MNEMIARHLERRRAKLAKPTVAMHLIDTDRNTITHALRVAAERFDDHAKTFVKLASGDMAEDSGPFTTAEGARRLMEQFEIQAAESRMMADLIERAERVTLQNVEADDECEAA